MKKVLSLFILFALTNSVFAGVMLQDIQSSVDLFSANDVDLSTPFNGVMLQETPPPPIDPFGSDDGDPLPIDMALYPILILGSIMMVYLVKYKKILFN